MARPVIWLQAALDDVDAIAAYIARASVAYASTVVRRLMSETRNIAEFPFAGQRVPEWNDERLRERIVYRSRLLYKVEPERVLVLGVIHGARLLPDDFHDRAS